MATSGTWGNLSNLPGYSEADQKSAFALDLTNQQNQINAGRTQNQALASALQKRALGETPSLATAQLKASSDRSLAQQLAAAGAGRGGNSAATQRTLAQNQAVAGQQIGQQAAATSLQEQAQNAQAANAAQATNQSYINQGMTAQQAKQSAAADYMKYVAAQQQAAAQQQTSIDTAEIAGKYGLESTQAGGLVGQAGSLIGGVLGGIGDIFADGGSPNFAKSIMKQKYVHAEDGAVMTPKLAPEAMGIKPIESLEGEKKESVSDVLTDSAKTGLSGAIMQDRGAQQAMSLYNGYQQASRLLNAFADGGVADEDSNIVLEIPKAENYEKTSANITSASSPESSASLASSMNPHIAPFGVESLIKAIASSGMSVAGGSSSGSSGGAAANGGIAGALSKKKMNYGDVLAARRK